MMKTCEKSSIPRGEQNETTQMLISLHNVRVHNQYCLCVVVVYDVNILSVRTPDDS